MTRQREHDVPVGRSGCRFRVGGRFSKYFPLTRSGYADAVRYAWNTAKLGQVNSFIVLSCSSGLERREIELAMCMFRRRGARPICEASVLPGSAGERPIAALRRRR